MKSLTPPQLRTLAIAAMICLAGGCANQAFRIPGLGTPARFGGHADGESCSGESCSDGSCSGGSCGIPVSKSTGQPVGDFDEYVAATTQKYRRQHAVDADRAAQVAAVPDGPDSLFALIR